MDDLTRKLLVRLAQTVLDVLNESEAVAAKVHQTIPPPPAIPRPSVGDVMGRTLAQETTRAPVDPSAIGKGAFVRFWDGNRHVVGEVVAIPRGKPRKLKIRVNCEGKRARTHTVEDDRVVFIRGGA